MRYLLHFFYLISVLTQLTLSAAPTHHVDSQPKITVIGAGLAGLTAAYRLHTLGYSCEIFEARQRPGGRVLTAYFNDHYDELGGKNVYDGGDGENILALIEEMGLQTETQFMRHPMSIIVDGQSYSYIDLLKAAPEPSKSAFLSLKEKIDTFKSLGDLIDSFFAKNPIVRHIMEISMQGWEGSSPYLLPPEYLEESFWEIYNRHYSILRDSINGIPFQRKMRSVQGGNSRLIAALACKVEEHIHYQRPLRKITRDAEQIWLHFDDESISTDYLILALPCTTLRDVEIQEGILAEDQLLAIRTLQYGTNAKLLLPVDHLDDSPAEFIQTGDFHIFVKRPHGIMTLYCGGQPGIFDASCPKSTKKLLYGGLPAICQVFPHITFPLGLTPIAGKDQMFAQYDQPVAISWVNEEFSKGSYSNYGLGTFALFNEFIEDFQEPVRKVFRSIEGRIFFAGEHTAPSGDNGTMDGAVYSGQRAARMLERSMNVLDILRNPISR